MSTKNRVNLAIWLSTQLLGQPKAKREVPPRGVHIELPGQLKEYDKDGDILIVMYCGYITKILDDGSLGGEDFYIHSSGGKASCEACLTAWRAT